MPVKLNSSGGGSVTITVPATASDFTATFPANTGNVVTDSATQTLTNKTLTSPTITGASVSSMSSSVLTSGTVNAGGTNPFPGAGGPTNVDFTGIPSWVKRVTVMFNGVSTSGASEAIVQLGTSGGFVTSGYVGSAGTIASTVNSTNLSSGFLIRFGGGAGSGNLRYGAVVLTLFGSNSWTGTINCSLSSAAYEAVGSGTIDLSGTLDRIRITTVNGTDTFDAGSINILYE